MTRFILEDLTNALDNKLGSKGHWESKFHQEYIFHGVEEEKLLEFGFKFVSYDLLSKYPIYRYENLEAIYDQRILHIYETTV